MSNDEKFVQWLKITLASFGLGMLFYAVHLLQVIAHKI